MISTAVILAAGRGSRLKEVTATRSKALAPIAGRPIIGHVMSALRNAGISRFVVVRGAQDQELAAFCSADGSTEVLTQQTPRGSGDALRVCEGAVPDHFVVSACDSLVASEHFQELIKTHARGDALATLSLMDVAPEVSLASRSVVKLEGDRVLRLIEKPKPEERLSDTFSLPHYVLSREIFNELAMLPVSPRGEYELPAAFQSGIGHGKIVRGVKAAERLDLTDQRDLISLNLRFLEQLSPQIQIDPSAIIPRSVEITGPVLIEAGVQIGEGAKIGPGVYVERNARIGAGCAVRRAVILRDSVVDGDVAEKVVTASP